MRFSASNDLSYTILTIQLSTIISISKRLIIVKDVTFIEKVMCFIICGLALKLYHGSSLISLILG